MKTLISIIVLCSSQAVFAWGNTGHRVVGEVATKYLSTSTLVKINKILKGQSLARVATWPDEIKSDPTHYEHTFNWHYTTWPTEASEHSEHDETSSTGFLLKAISEQLTVLRDPLATDENKMFALKFIVHLIGDIHMPLHVGTGLDQGGNLCKVTFMGKPTNLHALWDEGMIGFTNLSFTELAKFIIEERTLEDFVFAKTGSLTDWALESKNIVAQIYPADVVVSEAPLSMKSYCKKDVLPEEMPKLSYEYSYRFVPVVEKRLYEAGVRLAMLLEQNMP
jgi:hypothetical protein